MSHWEKVETQVTELDILQSACEELGAECLLNEFARGWGRQRKKSDMVIRIPESRYDIAVTKAKDGDHYVMDMESMDYEARAKFEKDGHNLGKILEMYSVHKAEGLCRKKRKKWKRVVHPTHTDVVVTV